MNTSVKTGVTLAEEQFVEMKLKGGWRAMWFATFLSPLFPIAIFLMAVAVGHGIGVSTWPTYRSKGMKLAFWGVMGPLLPWILFITAAVIWRNIR